MILELKDVRKVYDKGVKTIALDGLNLNVEKGEFVGVMGPSGSGKTTMLNLISTIDNPTSGEIKINGKNSSIGNNKELALFRRRELGIVFQSFNLIDSLSVYENMALPMVLEGKPISEIDEKVRRIAKTLGIEENLEKKPYEVSGGQAQRTAIGRAVINNPSILLADEPTGNLDTKSSDEVMNLFRVLNEKEGLTVLLVTHDPRAASYCDRVVFIKDGQLHNEIHKGEEQKEFFGNIMDTLSFLNTSI